MYNGVFRSSDGGGSWRSASVGLTSTNVRALALDPRSASTLYAGTGSGVFKSTDAGETWGPASLLGKHISALAIDPRDPNIAYAATDLYAESRSLFKSTDGGRTWVDTGIGRGILALAIDPQRPEILYAGTLGDGVFKSTDAGGSWKAVNTGLTSPRGSYMYVNALAVDSTNPEIVYVTTNAGVFASTDGGESWRAVNAGLPEKSNVLTLAIDQQCPDTVYVGTFSKGVFKSTDRGQSWQPFSRGLRGHGVFMLAIDPSREAIYAGTNGGGVVSASTSRCDRVAR